MTLHKTLLFSLPLFLTSCAGMMPLVGLDKNGDPVMERVDENQYTRRMANGLKDVKDSVLPALHTTDEDSFWQLRTAVLGLGVKVEGGIGPFKVGVRPRIRAAFANGQRPPVP